MSASKLVMGILSLLLGIVLTLMVFHPYVFPEDEDNSWENNITPEEAELELATMGKPLDTDAIYFHDWTDLDEAEQEKWTASEKPLLLSEKAYQTEQYDDVIRERIEAERAVLLHGLPIDTKETFTEERAIPFQEVESSVPLDTFIYGVGYSMEEERLLPVIQMGNLERDAVKEDMEAFVRNYAQDRE